MSTTRKRRPPAHAQDAAVVEATVDSFDTDPDDAIDGAIADLGPATSDVQVVEGTCL